MRKFSVTIILSIFSCNKQSILQSIKSLNPCLKILTVFLLVFFKKYCFIKKKKSTPDIDLIDIKMIETISGEGFPVLLLHVKVNYLNQ